jgi:hypothetical protein
MGGRGREKCRKIFNKNVSCAYIAIICTLKIKFVFQPTETKKLAKIICEDFELQTIILRMASRTYFVQYKKALLVP